MATYYLCHIYTWGKEALHINKKTTIIKSEKTTIIKSDKGDDTINADVPTQRLDKFPVLSQLKRNSAP